MIVESAYLNILIHWHNYSYFEINTFRYPKIIQFMEKLKYRFLGFFCNNECAIKQHKLNETLQMFYFRMKCKLWPLLKKRIYDKQGLTSLLLYTCIGENFNRIEAEYFYNVHFVFVRIFQYQLVHKNLCRIYL